MEIVPDTEDGGFGARYPGLPGCITFANTIEEVHALAENAKREWIMAALEEGIEIQEPMVSA